MLYILYIIYIIYIYYIYFPIMAAHVTITTIYIIVVEVSCMNLLLCAIYQNQKGVWLVCLFF